MSLNDITIKLFDYVDNDTKENKAKLLLLLKTFKDDIKEQEDKLIEAKEIYNSLIHQRRIIQNDKYELYYFERNELYKKWKKSREYKDLIELVNFLPPELEEIPEIYTYNYNFYIPEKKDEPEVDGEVDDEDEDYDDDEDEDEDKSLPPTPKKKEDKSLPPTPKKKEDKSLPPTPKKKECPPGSILNEKTGRCNKIKTKKNPP